MAEAIVVDEFLPSSAAIRIGSEDPFYKQSVVNERIKVRRRIVTAPSPLAALILISLFAYLLFGK